MAETGNTSEVEKTVLNELKNFGENYKKAQEALLRNYEELKATVEQNSKDIVTEAKLQKLAEDIAIRQNKFDEAMALQRKESQDQMEKLEIAMKRPGKSVDGAEDFEKESKSFGLHLLAAGRKNENGVGIEELSNIKMSTAEYELYKKSFELWARKYGGDSRLAMSPENLKALQVGIDPDGGYTVPVSMSNRIIQRMFESDPIRQLATVEGITTGAIEWMVDVDEAGYEWEGETHGETTLPGETSTPGWKKKRIVTHQLSARPRATQTLLEDSGINIEAWLATRIGEKFSRAEGAAFVNGDGVGKPKGFLQHDNGTSWGQIEQINLGAASVITADGLVEMKYALKEFFHGRATWLMNRTTVMEVMKLKDGDGSYLWKPSMITGDPSSTILGLPVRMSTTMPAVAADALAVAIADWREAYMIVDRLGITIQRDPYTVKPFIEFYTRKRVGGDVINYDAIKIGKISA